MNFELATDERDGKVWVIALGGEIDLYTAPALKEELVRAAEAGARSVVVDLTETTFLDSTALGVLIGAVKRLRPSGGSVELVVTDRNIRKVFEITGLDRVFVLHANREAALGAATTS